MSETSSKNCVVCGSPNVNGIHFDVECCRACAAFFRRRAEKKFAPCKNVGSNSCDLKICKSCRIKKCREVGMNMKKFQYNRDAILPQALNKVPPSLSKFVGRPELVLFCIPDTFDDNRKTFIDVRILIQKATRIIENGPDLPYTGTNQLHKLSNSFQFSTSCLTPKRVSTKISKPELVMFWEYYVLRTAKWLANFEEFQKIPNDMKVKLLLVLWHAWGRLDKLIATARSKRQNICNNEKMWAMSNGAVFDVDKTVADLSWMSKYPVHQLFYFLEGIANWSHVPSIEKLIDSDVSDMEINFMLAQLAFSYAGKRLQGDIANICERFQEVLANDLHDYYVNDLKMVNYSARLSQLMKINNAIQKDIWMSRERSQLASVFNVFHVEFSHPEMFKDTGYH